MKELAKQEQRAMCYFVPLDAYVEGEGYRASIVVEGQAGHHPTGSHPYHGRPEETRPYFWGHDHAEAQVRTELLETKKRLADLEKAHERLARESQEAIDKTTVYG